jgi:opacity protein-like surface antigen
MNRRLLALAALLSLTLAGSAVAATGSSTPLAWGIGAGLSQPFGDFGDAAKLGFAFAGTCERPFNDRLALGGELLIDRHTAKDLPRALGGGNVDGTFTVIGVSPYLTMKFGDTGKPHPFARGGLGVYHTRTSIKGTSVIEEQSDSSTDFGMRLGGGIETQAGPALKLGASADYHAIFADATESFMVIGVYARFGGSN